MHPSFAIILFTVLSGSGYGMLAMLGYGAATRLLPPNPKFALLAFAIALAMITVGLFSSLFHLGRPSRSWRAMSQWRSSWLSREGTAALLTYVPTLPFAAAWALFGINTGFFAFCGAIAAVLALVTVFCTAMIYASLKPIHQWYNRWVVPAYLVMAIMTGALWVNALLQARGLARPSVAGIAAGAALIGFMLKIGYWRFVDTTAARSTPQTATGLDQFGRVRLIDPPHTQENFLSLEMGYRLARKHAWQLRRISLSFGFFVPFVLAGLTIAVTGRFATILALAAASSAILGVLIERWLFFAEAKHTVVLYYGAESA
ncbi:MAG: dimethyl sulfoxide reductase anchor subunit family protein [Rhodospirillales bacterium]